MKRLLVTHLIPALALAGLLAWGVGVSHADTPKEIKKESHIDLVICLDTSNSMDGLIESAKVKLWDIVNELAKAKPTPHLRIALFSYGSPEYGAQSGWVRRDLDFTDDLDMVYQKLFALRTRGGTEYVARVTKAALDDLKWTNDAKALKMIFVCGNESASQDPKFKLEDVAKDAIKQNIFVNTIHCRRSSNDRDSDGWQKFAALAEGRFVSIDQNRGAVAINTPVDKKLAQLGAKLNTTYLWYGKEGAARQQNQLAQDSNAAKLGGGVAASRAAGKASHLYRMAEADLVDRCLTEKNFDLSKVPEKQLPESLRKLKPAEREKYVEQKKTERVLLQKEIAELSKQRQEYLREHQKKNQGSAERAFDDAIRATLRAQAKARSIRIPD